VAKNHSRSIYLGSELDVAAVASACHSHSLTSYDDTAAVDAQRSVVPTAGAQRERVGTNNETADICLPCAKERNQQHGNQQENEYGA
jgi:hypothetical protein